jgi:anti-sigma regulatory factor (Ser/Thr protein kinase)
MVRGGENSTMSGESAAGHRSAGTAGLTVDGEEPVGPPGWQWPALDYTNGAPTAVGVTTNGQHGRAVLPPGPAAAGVARRFARAALDAWHLDAAADAVELVVSELVTNAIRHAGPAAAGAPVWLVVAWGGDVIRVEVHDGDARHTPRPSAPVADELAEGGRGLALIQALGLRWGCGPVRAGKSVWCELPATPG